MLWFVNKAFYFKGCRLSYLLTSLTAYHEPEPSNENNMPCSFKLIQDTLQPPQEEAPCLTSSAAESCPFSPCPSLPGGVLGLSPACLHGSGGATAPPLRIILAQCCVRIIQSFQVFYEIINLLPTTQAVAASLHSQAEEQPMPLSSHMSHTGFWNSCNSLGNTMVYNLIALRAEAKGKGKHFGCKSCLA